jgi:DNA-binding XRE family transcriptional regulator
LMSARAATAALSARNGISLPPEGSPLSRKFSGARCRQKRRETGLRAEAVALVIGRSSFSLAEYEQGRITPPLPVAVKLADLYGCGVDDFLIEEAVSAA